jgi:hypothetical protein
MIRAWCREQIPYLCGGTLKTHNKLDSDRPSGFELATFWVRNRNANNSTSAFGRIWSYNLNISLDVWGTLVSVNNAVAWDVPRHLVDRCQRFGGTCCPISITISGLEFEVLWVYNKLRCFISQRLQSCNIITVFNTRSQYGRNGT